jgi:hypothetical protein
MPNLSKADREAFVETVIPDHEQLKERLQKVADLVEPMIDSESRDRLQGWIDRLQDEIGTMRELTDLDSPIDSEAVAVMFA